jgi:AraC-like DNA-binding protein
LLLHEQVRVTLLSGPTFFVTGHGRRMLVPDEAIVVTPPMEAHTLLPATDDPWSAKVLLLAPSFISRAAAAALQTGAHTSVSAGACGAKPSVVSSHPASSFLATSRVAGSHVAVPAPARAESPHFTRAILVDRALRAEFAELFDELWSPVRDADCERRLSQAVARLVTRCATSEADLARPTREMPRCPVEQRGLPRRVGAIRRLHTYLVEHVADPVSLDDMAAAAGLSKYYLLRAFQRAYGASPRSYLMELRLARARTLLMAGVSPSRVTYDAGFADHSHLTRRFKRGTGMTPSCFARQLVTAPCSDPCRPASRDSAGRIAG